MAGPVLVLGGQGFLGRRICEALQESGHEGEAAGRSAGLKAALLDPSSLAAAIEQTRPGAVVCAAGVSSAGAAHAEPVSCLEANVTGISNLVEAMRSRPGCHLTLLSSAAVYAPSSGPLTEKSKTRAGSIYGASKLAAEMICDWQRASGRPVAVLRVFNLNGPGQGSEQVPGEFARALLAAESEGREHATVPVRNPSISRDFTDVRDAGQAVAAVAARRAEGTFNLCSGRNLSLDELAGLFGQDRIELEAALKPRPGDTDRISGDPTLIREVTGWEPSTPLGQSALDLLAGLRDG